jgi:sulfane dehydrogenase subunit SoxC
LPILPVARNGLLDRRALLGRGVAFAGAISTGAVGSLATAAAEPLTEMPWSLEPGAIVQPYEAPSRFEKHVVRTLNNPEGKPSTQNARTPHHLVNGTITPNGLHFVVSYGGPPDIDPEKHRLVIHGLVKRPLVFTLEALTNPLPNDDARHLPRMRRQQCATVFTAAASGERAGAPRARLLR